MSTHLAPERVHTVIIGGGQAGLSVGYFLAQRGVPFVILDAEARVGDAWRKRWDSLRLFSPARFDGLAGMPFPGDPQSFPTKDEMADYLESYATRFQLPVRSSTRVDRLWRDGDAYRIQAGEQHLEAAQVVIAMANFQSPRVPPFADQLSGTVVQMHSRDYRSLRQLRPGAVLVVGAGNSGAEIATECAGAGHATWLAGPDVGHAPFRLETFFGRRILAPILFRVFFHRVLSLSTPIGRRMRTRLLGRATPLIRQRPTAMRAAGIRRVARVVGVKGGKPLLDDGTMLDVANVIWCTGFTPALSWIDLPILDQQGEPRHERGRVVSEPGLSFVGRHFLSAMSSAMIHGVGRDAERIALGIAAEFEASGFAWAPDAGVRGGVSAPGYRPPMPERARR